MLKNIYIYLNDIQALIYIFKKIIIELFINKLL
jgi:hypothetical protein